MNTVKMSNKTMATLLAQEKIKAEVIDSKLQSGEDLNEWRNRLMNRKLLYMGQEIIIDDSIPAGMVDGVSSDRPKIGQDRFKAPSPRATVDNTGTKTVKESDLKREILF